MRFRFIRLMWSGNLSPEEINKHVDYDEEVIAMTSDSDEVCLLVEKRTYGKA